MKLVVRWQKKIMARKHNMQTRFEQAENLFKTKKYLAAYKLYNEELAEKIHEDTRHYLSTRRLECLMAEHAIDLEKAKDEFAFLEVTAPKNNSLKNLDQTFGKLQKNPKDIAIYQHKYGLFVAKILNSKKNELVLEKQALGVDLSNNASIITLLETAIEGTNNAIAVFAILQGASKLHTSALELTVSLHKKLATFLLNEARNSKNEETRIELLEKAAKNYESGIELSKTLNQKDKQNKTASRVGELKLNRLLIWQELAELPSLALARKKEYVSFIEENIVSTENSITWLNNSKVQTGAERQLKKIQKFCEQFRENHTKSIDQDNANITAMEIEPTETPITDLYKPNRGVTVFGQFSAKEETKAPYTPPKKLFI